MGTPEERYGVEWTENMRRTIDALRSGEYTQGFGVLSDKSGKMCAGGVFCDVSGRGEWVDNDNDYARPFRYETPSGEVGSAMCLLPSMYPSPSPRDLRVVLPDDPEGIGTYEVLILNDGLGYTFQEIADIWEKSLNGVDGYEFVSN